MAATRRAIRALEHHGTPDPRHKLSEAKDGDRVIPSPALALQAALTDAYARSGEMPEPFVEKWSLRTRAVILIAAAPAAWALLIVSAGILSRS